MSAKRSEKDECPNRWEAAVRTLVWATIEVVKLLTGC